MSNNLILIDWLSFSTKTHSIEDIKSLLGADNIKEWQEVYGFYGYAKRMYFNGISIHYEGRPDMGILVEMSGQGCRTFESMMSGDYEVIFRLIKENPQVKITRLDVAYDDHEGIFNLKTMCEDTRKKNYIAKFRQYQIIEGSEGITINHGSKTSDVFVRIYDKAKERDDFESHWVRFELQMRDERAFQFILNNGDIGDIFKGVVYNYIRYVKPNLNDSHQDRRKNTSYWNKFIASAEKIKLYVKPGLDYNLNQIEKYVFGQSGKSIATYIEIMGRVSFEAKLNEVRKQGLNAKQKMLIEEYQGYRENKIRNFFNTEVH